MFKICMVNGKYVRIESETAKLPAYSPHKQRECFEILLTNEKPSNLRIESISSRKQDEKKMRSRSLSASSERSKNNVGLRTVLCARCQCVLILFYVFSFRLLADKYLLSSAQIKQVFCCEWIFSQKFLFVLFCFSLELQLSMLRSTQWYLCQIWDSIFRPFHRNDFLFFSIIACKLRGTVVTMAPSHMMKKKRKKKISISFSLYIHCIVPNLYPY